jgi:DegV family protein with EDD domain
LKNSKIQDNVMHTAIVTDSTCDLPAILAEASQIHVIPTILVIENESLEDGPGISRTTFYTRLPNLKTAPTTAAPAVGTFEALYARLFNEGYEQVLSLHLSEKLSGVINAAHAAAQAFGERVKVLDSQQLSMGLGFQALAAAEGLRRNASVTHIQEILANLRSRTHLVALLDTLEYVRRSGRVSWARAAIGSLLDLKPFLEVRDGLVLRRGEARTRKKGIKRLREMLLELGTLEKLAILHTNDEGEARGFFNSLGLSKDLSPLFVNVTPVIGAHVGPDALGFVAVTT